MNAIKQQQLRKEQRLTAEMVCQVLSYDAETGLFTWLCDPAMGPRRKGTVAGCLQSKGYIHIKIRQKKFMAHRLAWLVVHGYWPERDVDHVNGRLIDNRLVNLREATRSENCANRTLQSRGVSGAKGVHWNKKSKKWQVGLKKLGRRIHVGVFQNLEDAKAAYQQAAIETFGPYARTT